MKELLASLKLEHVRQAANSIAENMAPSLEEDSNFVNEIMSTANLVVARMNEIEPNKTEGRKGGVLLLQKEGENGYISMEIIGEDQGGKPSSADEVEWSNPDKHALYAIGKAITLVNNQTLLGSAQNKDLPDEEQQHITLRGSDIPGGSLRINGMIYSFSGYSAEDDECVILATLEEKGILSREQALQCANNLHNQRYQQIVDQLVH